LIESWHLIDKTTNPDDPINVAVKLDCFKNADFTGKADNLYINDWLYCRWSYVGAQWDK
jgi:hypothetical protein